MLDCRPRPLNKKVMVQKEYEVAGKTYRFTEHLKGYIRLDINKTLQPKIDFYNWGEVEEFINNLKNSN